MVVCERAFVDGGAKKSWTESDRQGLWTESLFHLTLILLQDAAVVQKYFASHSLLYCEGIFFGHSVFTKISCFSSGCFYGFCPCKGLT